MRSEVTDTRACPYSDQKALFVFRRGLSKAGGVRLGRDGPLQPPVPRGRLWHPEAQGSPASTDRGVGAAIPEGPLTRHCEAGPPHFRSRFGLPPKLRLRSDNLGPDFLGALRVITEEADATTRLVGFGLVVRTQDELWSHERHPCTAQAASPAGPSHRPMAADDPELKDRPPRPIVAWGHWTARPVPTEAGRPYFPRVAASPLSAGGGFSGMDDRSSTFAGRVRSSLSGGSMIRRARKQTRACCAPSTRNPRPATAPKPVAGPITVAPETARHARRQPMTTRSNRRSCVLPEIRSILLRGALDSARLCQLAR